MKGAPRDDLHSRGDRPWKTPHRLNCLLTATVVVQVQHIMLSNNTLWLIWCTFEQSNIPRTPHRNGLENPNTPAGGTYFKFKHTKVGHMAVPRNALAYAGQHGEDASSANVVSLPLSTSIALSLAFDVSRLLEEMALNSRRSRARSLRSNQALLDAQRDARESTVDFVGAVRASKNSGNSENVCSLQVFGCLLSDLLLTSHQYLYFRLSSSHSSSPPASPPATRTCLRRSASLRFTSSRTHFNSALYT